MEHVDTRVTLTQGGAAVVCRFTGDLDLRPSVEAQTHVGTSQFGVRGGGFIEPKAGRVKAETPTWNDHAPPTLMPLCGDTLDFVTTRCLLAQEASGLILEPPSTILIHNGTTSPPSEARDAVSLDVFSIETDCAVCVW